MVSRALFLPLLLALAAGSAHAEMLMVYSMQRHGARNVLPKTSLLKESDAANGPALLPQGQRQAYNAGLAYRARYLNSSACAAGSATCLDAAVGPEGPRYGVVGTPDGGTFHAYNTHVRSSPLDRTVSTARAFLDAVFPALGTDATADGGLPDGEQVVPVYSLAEDGSAALVRAYTECPAYDARLAAWYDSPEFAAKESESAALRASVAALFNPAEGSVDTSLAGWWTVFDSFNVHRTYGVGTPMPNVSDAMFADMRQLADWLETRKMASALTGNLLGGLVLGDLLRYLDAAGTAAAATTSVPPSFYRLLHLSAHYNSMLGVLGALGLDTTAADTPWLSKIPALAAVMAFELHGNTQRPAELAIRLVAQDGPTASYAVVPLPCAAAGDSAEALAGPGACTLEAFRALAQPRALGSVGEWCEACGNEAMGECRLQLAEKTLAAAESSCSGGGGGGGISAGAVAGIAVGCAAAAAAAVGGVAWAVVNRRAAQHRRQLVGVYASTP